MSESLPIARPFAWIGVLALALCTFMQVLDSSIANVSLPHIAGDLSVNADQGIWVITMFAVGNASCLPLTGWLMRRFGLGRLLVFSILSFTAASWLCGISNTIEMLVAARFLQGCVSGPLIPLSQSLMLMTFPQEKRTVALAISNMVTIVGPIAGPILGGWITYNYSWPWIFFINIPIGLFCAITIRAFYQEKERVTAQIPFDGVGLLLLVIAVSSFQVFIDKGQTLDWWNSTFIWTLAITSFISFIAFLIWELFQKDPIVDLTFFKNRNFLLGTALASTAFFFIFGTIVVTSLWLQQVMGYTPYLAGLAVSTMGLIPFFTVLFVAKLMIRVPLRFLVMCSFLAYFLSFSYFSTFTTAVTFKQVAFFRFCTGIGVALWLAPLSAMTFAGVPNERLAMGQGIFQFFRILMGGAGASLCVTLWQRRATFHHSYLAEGASFLREKTLSLTRAMIDQVTWKQAYMLATNDLFWMSAWIFFLFIFFALLFKKHPQKAL